MLCQEYPIMVACDVVGCARSSYYYQPNQRDETEIKAAIEAVAAEWPTYGYRRVAAQLRRQGWVVNHKRVRRLMREMGLQARIKRKKRKTTDSKHNFPR